MHAPNLIFANLCTGTLRKPLGVCTYTHTLSSHLPIRRTNLTNTPA
uniref:Uncharacterized protein n=1 Tax=Arundo donax TaxID=35708 RepID=A0A0A9A977_ARUDO